MLEILWIARFDQVLVKTGFHDRPPIGGTSVTGQGDQTRLSLAAQGSEAAHHFIAVESWQSDVDQRNIELVALQRFQAGDAVFGDADDVAVQLQQCLKHGAAVVIVLDDQNPRNRDQGRCGLVLFRR